MVISGAPTGDLLADLDLLLGDDAVDGRADDGAVEVELGLRRALARAAATSGFCATADAGDQRGVDGLALPTAAARLAWAWACAPRPGPAPPRPREPGSRRWSARRRRRRRTAARRLAAVEVGAGAVEVGLGARDLGVGAVMSASRAATWPAERRVVGEIAAAPCARPGRARPGPGRGRSWRRRRRCCTSSWPGLHRPGCRVTGTAATGPATSGVTCGDVGARHRRCRC